MDVASAVVILTFYLPERFRHELFDGLVPLHDEAHGRELAAAVTQELVGETVGELVLQPHGLEAGEGSAYPKIKLLKKRKTLFYNEHDLNFVTYLF